MAEYKTQMEAAKMGIITPQMEAVAKKEYRDPEFIRQMCAEGKVAICANKNHKCLDPNGVGSMLRTKINVNLGVSRDVKNYDEEMEKVMAAVNMGAEAIMDLSSHGDTTGFRRKLTSECPAMIGTVPVYDSVIHYQRDLDTLTAKDFIDVVRLHAEDGVDFVTLHCGITRKTIEQIRKHKRKMNIVSRGGSLVFAWMCMTGNENPFYEYYDEILDICHEYDVTISLGDACRPGCIADAGDVCQIEELVRLGELTKRAWEKNVQVMVEGPGHVPLDQVEAAPSLQISHRATTISLPLSAVPLRQCRALRSCAMLRLRSILRFLTLRTLSRYNGKQDSRSRCRYCKAYPACDGYRQQNGRCKTRPGLGSTVGVRSRPRTCKEHTRRPRARA